LSFTLFYIQCIDLVVVFYSLYTARTYRKVLNNRKKILFTAFPELKSKSAFKKRRKEIIHYLKMTNPQNKKLEKASFILTGVLYILVILIMIKLPALLNSNHLLAEDIEAVNVTILVYVGIVFLVLGIIGCGRLLSDHKNNPLLENYLNEHPENELKLLPYSKSFEKEYSKILLKITQLLFLSSLMILLTAAFMFFF
jgi:hypothetical protein